MPQFDDKDNEARAYQLIFNALIAGSDVEVTKDHVYIRSADGLTSEMLEQLFTRPETVKRRVGKYVFIPGAEANVDANADLHSGSLRHALLPRSAIPELPNNFLNALFATEILRELNLHAIDPAQLSEIEGNVIYPIPNYGITAPLWKARIDMLRMVLQNAGTAGLARVFSKGQPLALISGGTADPVLTKHAEDLIGVKFDPKVGDSAFLYLNQRYLTDLVVTPKVTTEAGTIRVDKAQLAAYLGRVFGNMIIPNQPLRATVDHALSLVTPIIVPQVVANPIHKQNVYMFVIDVSSSLDSVQYQYKNQLVSMVERLVEVIRESSDGYVNPRDVIRLVFFSGTSSYKDFTVTEALSSVKNLKQSIYTAVVSGSTMLDGTVAIQIDELVKLCSSEDCNANMFIFTDGEDNASSNTQKELLQQRGDQFRAQRTNLIPKFHIFRVGTADVSHIDAISVGIDATIHNSPDVGQLDDFFADIRDLNLHRAVVKFMQSHHEVVVPVFDGRLTVGPDIDVTKPVTVKGKPYTVAESPNYVADDLAYAYPNARCSYFSGDLVDILPHPSLAVDGNDFSTSLGELPPIVNIDATSCKPLTWQRNQAIMCSTDQPFDMVITSKLDAPISDSSQVFSYQGTSYQGTIDGNVALCIVLGRLAVKAAAGLCSTFMWKAAACSSSNALLPAPSSTCEVPGIEGSTAPQCRML